MELNEYINNLRLIEVLNFYTASGNGGDKTVPAGTALQNMLRNMQSRQMVVPVLGMQGMGKSTLINGILGKNILPNEADETTCVPVEVCYGEEEYAEVFFKERDDTEIVHTREELGSFVDNNENPANEKGVTKIVLYDKLPLLKDGMVIVDLPGVGSLTPENAEVTNNYIRNLCTAVFVIPTIPTIRKQEVTFIKSVWSQFPTAIFVQNHWGEIRRELEESVDYNKKVLKKIASELNTDYNGEIFVVNARDALDGAVKGDAGLVEQSGLPLLLSELKRFSDKWEDNMLRNMASRLYLQIQNVQGIIGTRLHELDLTEEQIRREREAALEEFKNQTKELGRKIRDVEDYLDSAEVRVNSIAAAKSEECASNIRAEVFMLIDKGIVDGEQLSSAFRHIQENCVNNVFDEMFDEFLQIRFDLEEKLEELEDIITKNEMSFGAIQFENGDAFKFEKAFGVIGGIAGDIGGIALGAMLGGPIGVIVVIAMGVAGGALGALAKKLVKGGRAKKTKEEITPYIDEIQKGVYSAIVDEFKKIRNNISEVLKQLKDDRHAQQLQLTDSIYSFDDNGADRQKLLDDQSYLKKISEEVKESA